MYSGGHRPDLYLEWEALQSPTVFILLSIHLRDVGRELASENWWVRSVQVCISQNISQKWKLLRIHEFRESFCPESAAKHKPQRLCSLNATLTLWCTWCSSFVSSVLGKGVDGTRGSHLCSLQCLAVSPSALIKAGRSFSGNWPHVKD